MPAPQFPGSRHLYGIPERASDLALRPTWGPEGALSGGHAGQGVDNPCLLAVLVGMQGVE